MRHALVTVHLVQEARAAADAEADERRAHQATADPRLDPEPTAGRFATLARRLRTRRLRTRRLRTRAGALGVRAETPGGGA